MTTDQYEAMKAFVEANGDRSVSSFVCRAISFYMAYLKLKGATVFLAPIIVGTIKSEILSVDKNLSEMIFKSQAEVKEKLSAAIQETAGLDNLKAK